MIFSLTTYFLKYLTSSRSRQRILLMAIVALIISSMSLLVVQSTMGALQGNLIKRSMGVEGEYLISVPFNYEKLDSLKELLKKNQVMAQYEIESELLLKHKNYVLPVTIHGVMEESYYPDFLSKKSFNDFHLSATLAAKSNSYLGETIEIISARDTDALLGEIPRSVTGIIESFVSTDVPEIDDSHIWTRATLVQNLLRVRSINRIRVFNVLDAENFHKSITSFDPQIVIEGWHERHQALSYALKLETSVMMFLFIMMILLVSLTIAVGLTTFYDKMKRDLTSFWILGASMKTLKRAHWILLFIINLGSILIGISLGTLLLFVIRVAGKEMMPDVFIDRSIPVSFSLQIYASSTLIPLLIGMIFSSFSYYFWRKAKDKFLTEIRTRSV